MGSGREGGEGAGRGFQSFLPMIADHEHKTQDQASKGSGLSSFLDLFASQSRIEAEVFQTNGSPTYPETFLPLQLEPHLFQGNPSFT